MSTLIEEIAQHISPKMEEKYQRYISGESYLFIFENYEYYLSEVHFRISDKWYFMDFFYGPTQKFNLKYSDKKTCFGYNILDAREENVNIEFYYKKIIEENYILTVLDGCDEYIFFSYDKEKFNFSTSDVDFLDGKYDENIDIEKLVHYFVKSVHGTHNPKFYFEKNYNNNDKNVKSNLIKRYYKNSLVDYKTTLGINKMFDTFY